jgi:hypothetical protein
MSLRRALQLVFVISLCGVTFSGTLTYNEVFGRTALACPSPGAPGTIFGYPACVYGLFMYIVIAGISGAGLWSNRRTLFHGRPRDGIARPHPPFSPR